MFCRFSTPTLGHLSLCLLLSYSVGMTNAEVTPLPERGTDWTIGKNVAILRLRADETQNKLAAVLGMSPQLFSYKLKGRRPWTAEEIEGAARHYRVTIDSLFRKLPDLDSNQEPAVISLASRHRHKPMTLDRQTLAPVTNIRTHG